MRPTGLAPCVQLTSDPEHGRRVAQDDGVGPVRFVALGPDSDPQALPPRALDQILHVPLTAEEPVLTRVGVQQEPLKVAKPVENQSPDFACVRVLVLVIVIMIVAVIMVVVAAVA